MGWVDPPVELGWVEIFRSWVTNISKILKISRPIYYVCNLYQTVCFVNMHFGASPLQLYIKILINE